MLRQTTIIDKINPLKEGKKILLQHYVNLWESTVKYFANANERGLQKELRHMGHTEFLGYFCHLLVFFFFLMYLSKQGFVCFIFVFLLV